MTPEFRTTHARVGGNVSTNATPAWYAWYLVMTCLPAMVCKCMAPQSSPGLILVLHLQPPLCLNSALCGDVKILGVAGSLTALLSLLFLLYGTDLGYSKRDKKLLRHGSQAQQELEQPVINSDHLSCLVKVMVYNYLMTLSFCRKTCLN